MRPVGPPELRGIPRCSIGDYTGAPRRGLQHHRPCKGTMPTLTVSSGWPRSLCLRSGLRPLLHHHAGFGEVTAEDDDRVVGVPARRKRVAEQT